MKTRLREKFSFDATHAVVINGEPEEVHSHTFKGEVLIEGKVKEGYIMDFLELRKIIEMTIAPLKHKNLNRIFKNPTTENIALWIAEQIKTNLPENIKLYKIILWEGDENGVEFEF